jgi:hypothetical protein
MTAGTFLVSIRIVLLCQHGEWVISDGHPGKRPVQMGGTERGNAVAKLNRLLCVWVGGAWAGAGLILVGTGLAIWDGAETAAAGVGVAVGAVMAGAMLTVAVWFARKRRS